MSFELGKSATIIFLLTIMVVLVGCGSDFGSDPIPDDEENSSGAFNRQDIIYVGEVVSFPPLPAGFEHINNITITGNAVYFTAETTEYAVQFSSSAIFSMNIDGTGITQLQNYTMNEPPQSAAFWGVSIDALYVSNDGYIWVVETGRFYSLDTPEGYISDEETTIDEYIQQLGSSHTVRKLDATGAEQMSIDISNLTADIDWFNVAMFAIDDDENIYIGAGIEANLVIYVIGADGNTQFRLDTPNNGERFILTLDGSIALQRWRGAVSVLQKIDVHERAWGESIELPTDASNLFSGAGSFIVLFTDGISIFGLCEETRETVRLLSFIDSGVSPDLIKELTLLPDGRIVLASTSEGLSSTGYYAQLILFSKTDNAPDTSDNEPVAKSRLTLGTLSITPEIQNAVVQFNSASATHYVYVIDYSDYTVPGDLAGALSRLTTEIMAGKIPDILHLNDIPFHNYAARGLFANMYPMLDADTKLDRESLMENVLRVAEIDGRLYRIPTSFTISTILGSSEVLGSTPGWTMDEFMSVLDANPQADLPFGPFGYDHWILGMMFYHNIHEFVDFKTGTAHFETDDFIKLLEFANTLPSEDDVNWGIEYFEQREIVSSGRQIMDGLQFGQFGIFQSHIELFGGDIVFKGWPSTSREGGNFNISSGVAITANAIDKDAAWEFVRIFITEDFQRDFVQWSFPINRAVFEEQLEEAMEYLWTTPQGEDIALSREAADQLIALIDSISGTTGHGESETLWNIVSEGATDFFNGHSTAENTAGIIQSRVAIYLAEQN